MKTPIIIGIFLVLVCAWQVYAAVNCTLSGGGRHADPEDSTCKNYTLCVYINSSTTLSYNYVCPSTSVFNPNSALCTASGNYNCTNTTTS